MVEKRLLQSIKSLLYVILFAPAVITYSTVYPFLHGKVFWIEIFTETLLGLYLVLILINHDYFPKRAPLFFAVSAFVGSLIISTFFSVDKSISFWGDWSRMTGLVLYLHLFVFFTVFSSVVRQASDRNRYLVFFSALGTLLSVFAWFQRYNINFLKAVWVGGRVGSALDNPAFFAIFLIFVIFANLWLFFNLTHAGNSRARFLFLAAAVFNFITIFITQTRGVILGVLLAIFVLLFYQTVKGSLKWKLGMLAGLTVMSFFLIFAPLRQALEQLPGFGRLLSGSLVDQTATTRLLSWDIAWRSFLARPIFGWGHEAFYAAFNKYYNPEFIKYSFAETWFDRSHNIFLDLLSTSGIIGLISYLAIFIYGFKVARKLGAAETRFLPQLYLGFSIAYFASNFFEFDTPSSLLAVFFIFAVLNTRHEKRELRANDANRRDTKNANYARMTQTTPSPTALVMVLVATILTLWFFPLKGIVASRALDRAGDLLKSNPAQGRDFYLQIISKKSRLSEPAALEYATYLNIIFATNPESIIDYREHYDLVMQTLERSSRRHPYDVNYALAYSLLANTLATVDIKFAVKAEEILEKIRTDINPDRQQVLLLLGETKLLLDKTDEAINILRRAQELAPTTKEVSYRLAIAYFAAEREKAGFAQLRKAEILGMKELGAGPLLILISVNADKGNWQKVAELYEQAVRLEPKNARLYAQMAIAYATIDNKRRAIESARKAIELDSSLKAEGEQLIRQLQK